MFQEKPCDKFSENIVAEGFNEMYVCQDLIKYSFNFKNNFMTSRYVFYLLVIVAMSSCAVLNKQEKTSVQTLAKAMNTGADLPADFAKQYYDIAFENLQLTVSFITNPADKVQQLKQLDTTRREADSVIKLYASGFGILKKYADLILALTDTSFLNAFNREKDAFVPAFDSLIVKYNTYYPSNKLPVTSLGSFAGKVLEEIGSRRIRYLQRKYLKELVQNADSVVANICSQYKTLDFYIKSKQLKYLDKDVDANYNDFVKTMNDQGRKDAYNYYQFYDPIYLKWRNKISVLRQFNQQTVEAMGKIIISHKKLLLGLEKKQTFKDLFIAIKDLYGSVNSLKESYSKFEKDFKPKN